MKKKKQSKKNKKTQWKQANRESKNRQTREANRAQTTQGKHRRNNIIINKQTKDSNTWARETKNKKKIIST